ncbi:ATP-binding protein [Alkalihalobacillus sp. LMS6]|uniref:AAA family ATPase n=1 Tax=Alkalihalobacillus sp. LMS6 TaxID=2924034 RepID=UPI0020D0CF18|nr:AAA family ATPase [Alkalihalobacillus sp. LMS6]UTR08549.1 ATP-binding protein [Alkalihalobacillus sp. LMS6]
MGPSGAGKTFSAIVMAYGMMREAYPQLSDEEVWGKVGVVDTEHERSLLYFGRNIDEDTKIGEFLHINFEPPYSTARYQEAVAALKEAGAEVIVIDSLSHNWQGEGGIVETHGKMSGNSFQNWGKLSTETSSLINTLTRNDVHIISTLRTKQEYAMEMNDKGKQQPVKIGTKPVQKDEMEYEFMLNLNINMDHIAKASKDNTHLFGEEEFQVTVNDGRNLFRWLELGVDVKAEEAKLKAEREEAEENERQQLLGEILKAVESNEEIKKELAGLEYKANETKVSDFNLKTMRRAHEILIKK